MRKSPNVGDKALVIAGLAAVVACAWVYLTRASLDRPHGRSRCVEDGGDLGCGLSSAHLLDVGGDDGCDDQVFAGAWVLTSV